MSDLLSRLDPQVLAHNWHRHYHHPGNYQQSCNFPVSAGSFAELEASYAPAEGWMVYFEVCEEKKTERRFVLPLTAYTQETAAKIADHINSALHQMYI